jgi:hypothetical protein
MSSTRYGVVRGPSLSGFGMAALDAATRPNAAAIIIRGGAKKAAGRHFDRNYMISCSPSNVIKPRFGAQERIGELCSQIQ